MPWSEWGVLVWLTLTPGPRRGPGPALEGVAEAGGFAEAELFGDGVGGGKGTAAIGKDLTLAPGQGGLQALAPGKRQLGSSCAWCGWCRG